MIFTPALTEACLFSDPYCYSQTCFERTYIRDRSFLSGRRGWWDLGGRGGHKKMALKGGSKEFKFCSDGICNNANSQPECQKTAFLTLKKVQIVSGKHALGPLLYVLYVFSYQSPSFLYCSFFDPDPESSCFGVSHYGGNVSEKATDLTSFPGFSSPTSR